MRVNLFSENRTKYKFLYYKLYERRIAAVSAVVVALFVCVIISVSSFAHECETVRESVLRLHIIANSDSDEDQNVKLLVRDALLEESEELLLEAENAEQAQKILENESSVLLQRAYEILRNNGFEYGAQIKICPSYFTTRSYGKYTLPAGEYLAVRVILGDGIGHNWWCVMFPPLCLPAAQSVDVEDAVGVKGEQLMLSGKRYAVRFKIVEWIENIRNDE